MNHSYVFRVKGGNPGHDITVLIDRGDFEPEELAQSLLHHLPISVFIFLLVDDDLSKALFANDVSSLL